MQPRQEIQQRPLAVVERDVVEVVEHARIAQRAQLGVHPAAAEDQRGFRRRGADRARHAERAVHVAGEGRGDGDDVGSLRGEQFARELIERFVDERGLAGQRLVQRIEGRRARGEPLAVARELEARVDAEAPDVGEVVDVQAGEVARLLGRAQRAEGRVDLLVERLFEARPFGKEGAADDAKGQARIAALQEADRRLHGVRVALGMREEVRDRRRHRRRACRRPSRAGAVPRPCA